VARLIEREELARRADEVRWFHSMDLGQGVVTEGFYDPAPRLANLHLPSDLSGKDVLDVGAWDGFYSFEAERRGARRVLATDWFSWGRGGWGTKAGFELARAALGSRVEDRDVDVLDLEASLGQFDVVLFLGVLYHLKHPLLALERLAAVTRGTLVLETHLDLVGLKDPAVAFYPGSECNDDPTNWCGPNVAAVEAMLQTAGFREVHVVWEEGRAYRAGRALSRARRHERGLVPRARSAMRQLRHGRAAFHAFR
jgi:tRNA (mo5U34)-methyltransferase